MDKLAKRNPSIVKVIANMITNSLKFQYLKKSQQGTKEEVQSIWTELSAEDKRNIVKAHTLVDGGHDEKMLAIAEEEQEIQHRNHHTEMGGASPVCLSSTARG